MPKAIIVESNPNPRAITLFLSEIPPCFQPFNRLGIAASDFANASPFAKSVLETGRKDISRMDFVRRGNEGELSFIGKLPWASERGTDPRPLQAFEGWNGKFLTELSAMKNKFNELATLDLSRDLVGLTMDVMNSDEVQSKLAKDGGDILVIDAPYDKKTNSFTAEIALLGSCSGCGKATETTIQGIKDRIEAATNGFRNKAIAEAPEGHPYRTITFNGLKETPLVGSFYSLNADYTPPKKRFLGIF